MLLSQAGRVNIIIVLILTAGFGVFLHSDRKQNAELLKQNEQLTADRDAAWAEIKTTLHAVTFSNVFHR